MTRDFIHINDFTILVEEAISERVITDACRFDEPVIAVAFYGSGNVDISVNFKSTEKQFQQTKGLALSFYADEQVEFVHTVSPEKPLRCLLIATSIRNLDKLPNDEGEIFSSLLNELVNPSDHYVEGPKFFMTPEMDQIVDGVFNMTYVGKTKMMFFRSQMTALLSHFFGQLASLKTNTINSAEREKLYLAKDILVNNLDNPPTLSELSRKIGLNTYNLKKNFKALFAHPFLNIYKTNV
ncbi:AraC family transcriptional regulator [Gaetbulibacter jejuensis]|uniref:HTH araC/xylS-type domain-containing protein n=1 Tax=Gaetbulibacter jejuensis TaxID=584607 RepID=A0ABN1JN70_9FLAO